MKKDDARKVVVGDVLRKNSRKSPDNFELMRVVKVNAEWGYWVVDVLVFNGCNVTLLENRLFDYGLTIGYEKSECGGIFLKIEKLVKMQRVALMPLIASLIAQQQVHPQ